MSNWRPKEWEEISRENWAEHGEDCQAFDRVFEAGADAMLEVVNSYLIPYGINFGEDRVVHSVGRRYKRVKKNLYLVVPNEKQDD